MVFISVGTPTRPTGEANLVQVERVAQAILTVLQKGIAPELAVPRWMAPMQLFRVATPPLYRWGMKRVAGSAVRPATPALGGSEPEP